MIVVRESYLLAIPASKRIAPLDTFATLLVIHLLSIWADRQALALGCLDFSHFQEFMLPLANTLQTNQ